MKKHLTHLCFAMAFVSLNVFADTHYVVKDNPGAASPYTSWATAAGDIQSVLDNPACVGGDAVLVSNGVYDSGGVAGWPAGSALTNRVTITNDVTVSAVSTSLSDVVIAGEPDMRGGTASNGATAARCVYISAGRLVGFTITNGYTLAASDYTTGSGGGVYGADGSGIVSNCVIVGNRCYYRGGGLREGTYWNCVVTDNDAMVGARGDAAMGGTLHNCFVHGHSGAYVLYSATLYSCVVSNNTSSYGTISSGTAYDCLIVDNSNNGARGATLYRCEIRGNGPQANSGGGITASTAYNCLIVGNDGGVDSRNAGGAHSSKLFNCTVISNTSPGVRLTATANCATNCIIYYNDTVNWAALPNDTIPAGALTVTNISYCCTTITNGILDQGNIDTPPNLLGDYRLSKYSPCIDAGTILDTVTNDFDGNPRPVDGNYSGTAEWDMGCFEYDPPPAGMIFIGW